MKKLITILLTILMVITLAGCDSDKESSIEQTEIIEPSEETLVGGFTDAEDKTITEDLKEIFDKALNGLLGANYEPVELVATQVVAGINYKFLAKGTKTTNPPVEGKYYITIYKDLDGNVELKDIEVIEEATIEAQKEEEKTKDITQMYFWVVFYDQNGYELQRTAEKYGTTPSFDGKLPQGFENWKYKKNDMEVTEFVPITTNTYFVAKCHKVIDKKPIVPTCQNKGGELGYIFAENDDKYYILWYQYNNNVYEHYKTDLMLKSQLSSYEIGDWFHYSESEVIGECTGRGDGVTLPTCPYNKIGDLFYIYDEEGSDWKINHYTFNSSSSKFIPCDSPDYDIKISKDSSYFDGYDVGIRTWIHIDYSEEKTLAICNDNGDSACFAEGTLINMADGTKKAVEFVKPGDVVLAYNHYLGNIEETTVAANFEYAEKKKDAFSLLFDNGSIVSVVTGHAFFEKETNMYVVVNKTNYHNYIGHYFYDAISDSWTELIDVELIEKPVRTFVIATYGNINCIADDMLCNEDGEYLAFVNVFDFKDDLTYDEADIQESIEKYGLWYLEEQDYITQEMIDAGLGYLYDAYNLKYFNIMEGKGLLGSKTIKDIVIENFENVDEFIE